MKCELDLWVDHLDSIARNGEKDERLAQLLAPMFFAWRTGTPAPEPPVPGDVEQPDDALWRMLANGTTDAEMINRSLTREGSLFPENTGVAIEVWTERELSGLHALWRVAVRDGREDWRTRVMSAARWHLAYTQPDNATNRPWGIHVFLLLSRDEECPEARLYAETLLCNCQVSRGRPDPLSRMILSDCADVLRSEIPGNHQDSSTGV